MPILRMKEIRDYTGEERIRKVAELRAELLRLRASVEAGGAPENPGRIKEIRRTIARLLTVEREESMKVARGSKGR